MAEGAHSDDAWAAGAAPGPAAAARARGAGRDPTRPGGFVLASGGRARAAVVVDEHAGVVERFAAAELQRYLARMSGATLPIVPPAGTAGRSLVLAQAGSPVGQAALARAGLTPPTQPEEFVLHANLAGACVVGADARAVLYGAYALLESLGVCWLLPDDDGEVVPARQRVVLRSGCRRERPALPVRMVAPMPPRPDTLGHIQRLIDLAAKLRFNACLLFAGTFKRGGLQECATWEELSPALWPELARRGFWLDVGHHCWDHFLSPEQHFAAHPDWFAEVAGARRPTGQLCLTNRGMRAAFAGAVAAFLARHPEITWLSLFANDTAGYCACAECRTWHLTDLTLDFVNDVATQLAARFPEVRFGHLVQPWALHAELDATPAAVAPAPNVVLYWVPRFRCHGHRLSDPDCETNWRYWANLQAWRARWPATPIVLYDYFTTTTRSDNMLVPFPTTIAGTVLELQAVGARGLVTIFSQCENWWTYGLNYWLCGRLAWDGGAAPEALVRRFSRAYFGQFGPTVAAVYRRLEQLARPEANYLARTWGRFFTADHPAGHARGRQADVRALQVLVAQAQALVQDACRRLDGGAGGMAAPLPRRLARLALAVEYIHLRLAELEAALTVWQALDRSLGGPREGTAPRAAVVLSGARAALVRVHGAVARYPALLARAAQGGDGVLFAAYLERELHARRRLYDSWAAQLGLGPEPVHSMRAGPGVVAPAAQS